MSTKTAAILFLMTSLFGVAVGFIMGVMADRLPDTK